MLTAANGSYPPIVSNTAPQPYASSGFKFVRRPSAGQRPTGPMGGRFALTRGQAMPFEANVQFPLATPIPPMYIARVL